MNKENILTGLNREQEQAVKHFEGPLLILAGAGSGKTRVLTHRVAYLISEYGVNPWNILALTFTNKAANEMRERVDAIVGEEYAKDIWVSTFHSTCVRILRRYIEAIGYDRSFTIYDGDDQKTLMKEILKYLQLDPKKYKERTMLNEISHAKDELITPEEYEKRAQGDYTKELCARCYKEYEKRLYNANALDFDDLICKTIKLLKENDDILRYYRNRFRFIMVDEYQDTNTAQFKLISLLAETTGEDGMPVHNLCVVGDDDQSIYKFRGANIYNILNFEQQYPETEVIKLEENYRSTGNILDAANAVIKNNQVRKQKALWTQKAKGEPIHYRQCLNEYDEAERIALEIAAANSDGTASYKDFAVLYRTNAQSRVLEEKLILHNIPYRIVGAVNFYQRKEIKDLLAYLRTVENGLDDISVKRIINIPKRGIGLTTIDRITNHAVIHNTSFYGALENYEYIDGLKRSAGKIGSFVSLIESFKNHLKNPDYSLEDLLREIIEETGYIRYIEEEDDTEKAKTRIENIEELINKIVQYETTSEEEPTLAGFLEEVALIADIDTVKDDNNLVLLMTLHSAKGLEFPYVYLVGMENNIFPGYAAVTLDDKEEMEEERRLCYVGITRAKNKLTLSSARSRFRNGEQQFNRPSIFLSEIPRYLLKQESGQTSAFLGAAEQSMQRKPKHSVYQKRETGPELLKNNPFISKGFSKKEESGTINYSVGDTVNHNRFGEGTVTEMVKKGNDYMVTVVFTGNMSRKMMASFAKLKKI